VETLLKDKQQLLPPHVPFPYMEEARTAAVTWTQMSWLQVIRQTVGITSGNKIPIVPKACKRLEANSTELSLSVNVTVLSNFPTAII